MIKTEYYDTNDNGMILVKTYSTENKFIRQLETGLDYEIASDVGVEENGIYKPKNYTYEETDEVLLNIEE